MNTQPPNHERAAIAMQNPGLQQPLPPSVPDPQQTVARVNAMLLEAGLPDYTDLIMKLSVLRDHLVQIAPQEKEIAELAFGPVRNFVTIIRHHYATTATAKGEKAASQEQGPAFN